MPCHAARRMQAKVASLSDVLADSCLKQVNKGATKAGASIVIFRYNVGNADSELLRLHARIHPLMRFYIDGASELDLSDARMDVLLAVQMDGTTPVAVLGILTFFKCVSLLLH
jgi:hypothetical protein